MKQALPSMGITWGAATIESGYGCLEEVAFGSHQGQAYRKVIRASKKRPCDAKEEFIGELLCEEAILEQEEELLWEETQL
ncbi:hypothetical protein L7F22_005392 [Adiantum nelumboides]|nr:hypothetical protein [Adiantum nelumboides]